jgi:hypothetical protein
MRYSLTPHSSRCCCKIAAFMPYMLYNSRARPTNQLRDEVSSIMTVLQLMYASARNVAAPPHAHSTQHRAQHYLAVACMRRRPAINTGICCICITWYELRALLTIAVAATPNHCSDKIDAVNGTAYAAPLVRI